MIYADSNFRLQLGCMLPSSIRLEDQDKERHFLKWKKDGDLEICGNKFFPSACEWDDFIFARGARVLSVLLYEYDEPTKSTLGSGHYMCYHTEGWSAAATTRVWVAGKCRDTSRRC